MMELNHEDLVNLVKEALWDLGASKCAWCGKEISSIALAEEFTSALSVKVPYLPPIPEVV